MSSASYTDVSSTLSPLTHSHVRKKILLNKPRKPQEILNKTQEQIPKYEVYLKRVMMTLFTFLPLYVNDIAYNRRYIITLMKQSKKLITIFEPEQKCKKCAVRCSNSYQLLEPHTYNGKVVKKSHHTTVKYITFKIIQPKFDPNIHISASTPQIKFPSMLIVYCLISLL